MVQRFSVRHDIVTETLFFDSVWISYCHGLVLQGLYVTHVQSSSPSRPDTLVTD